jgi:hypothetical protein
MHHLRRYLIFAAVALLTLGSAAHTQPAAAGPGRQVYAYYFGWYSGDSWNDGRLVDRPAIPYSSADGGAIARHIEQAQSAGIDAFIMSWFGPKGGNLTSVVFNMLLDQAAARGFHAAASVDMFEGGFNASTGEVLDSLRYLIGDRVNHPGYLRYNGKPVIYFWNQGRFSLGDWANIRGQIDPNHNTIWVMEGTNTSYLRTFDGLYLFNIAWSGNPAGTASAWYGRTRSAGGTFYTPTVMPGWDESRIAGRPNPTSPQARAQGAFLRNSWYGAVSSGANTILIVSWNEFLEGSYIEPSQALGSQALDILRPLIAAWKGHAPSVPAPEVAAQSASGPAQQVLTANYATVKVRAGAGLNYEQIGEIHQGETYPVLGKTNGWYRINLNGRDGYVSGSFVTVRTQ